MTAQNRYHAQSLERVLAEVRQECHGKTVDVSAIIRKIEQLSRTSEDAVLQQVPLIERGFIFGQLLKQVLLLSVAQRLDPIHCLISYDLAHECLLPVQESR